MHRARKSAISKPKPTNKTVFVVFEIPWAKKLENLAWCDRQHGTDVDIFDPYGTEYFPRHYLIDHRFLPPDLKRILPCLQGRSTEKGFDVTLRERKTIDEASGRSSCRTCDKDFLSRLMVSMCGQEGWAMDFLMDRYYWKLETERERQAAARDAFERGVHLWPYDPNDSEDGDRSDDEEDRTWIAQTLGPRSVWEAKFADLVRAAVETGSEMSPSQAAKWEGRAFGSLALKGKADMNYEQRFLPVW